MKNKNEMRAVPPRILENDAAGILADPLDKYRSLLEAVNGIIWEADAETMRCTFISDSVTRMLGYTPAQWMSDPGFWSERIYPADRERVLAFFREETTQLRDHSIEYRMTKADGSIVWVRDVVSIVAENGIPKWRRGIVLDISEARLMADLDHLEKEALEMSAQTDADIEAILNFYVLGIENMFPQMKCSVLRVMDDKLYNWASPSLPAAYTAPIRDKNIGPLAGSCGAAAYRKQRVIVNDIENDEIWAEHKQYALAHDLRASWSHPIIDSQGRVIATFGIYYHKVTDPHESHVAIIERSARLLKIIIENSLYAQVMQEMNMLSSQGQALANFGTWQWDVAMNKVTWSDALYDIYGLDKRTFKATFEGYMERLHSEDRDRVQQTIQIALATGHDTVFEERIIMPDGNEKYLRSWARCMRDTEDKPAKMIGACLDITHAKTTRLKLDEIAWMQSHVIRAPLARLMGLMNLLQEELDPSGEGLPLINDMIYTARELDSVIHNISDNTRF